MASKDSRVTAFIIIGFAATGPGGVSAITGFFQDNSIPGRSTAFADFTVWSLD